MNKNPLFPTGLLLAAAISAATASVFADNYPVSGRFTLRNLPNGWAGTVESQNCWIEGKTARCDGKSHILLTLGSYRLTLKSEELAFTADNKYVDAAPLLHFEDLNYDGLTDIAVRNGNNGNYQAPSYDVYVQTRSGRHIYSEELTELATLYQGLPDTIDAKRKILRVYSKSGCCEHYSEDFQVTRKGLRQIRQTQIYFDRRRNKDMVIESRLINGKWRNSKPRPWTGQD